MIFYFTGTGNSLYVANKMQELDGGELINMGRGLKEKKFNYKIKKGEKIGIIFPNYYWGLPTIVSEFMNNLKIESDETPFIYTIITCGANVGNGDKYLAKILKSKNLELNSSYSVEMPSNYIVLYDPVKKDINLSLNDAESEIEKIAESIKNNKEGYFADRGPVPIFSSIAQKVYGIQRKTKKFYVTEKCTSCGQCEEICPSETINIKDGNPEWTAAKCSHCVACISRCPQKAIEYGNSTQERKRYINPNVSFDNNV